MRSAGKYLVNQLISFSSIKYIFVILLALCLVGDFYLARSTVPDADTIQNYAQLLSVRDGNIFLRHWVLSSDNDYFTDLMFFVFLSFIFGKGLNLVFIVPFFVYCVFLSSCLLIVARAARNKTERYFGLFSVLFLLGLPYGPWLYLLFQSSIHTGTITLCLCAIVLAHPVLSGRPFRHYIFVPFTVLVFAISASDPFAVFFFLGPLPILVILRAWLFQKLRPAEWALFGCVIFGAAIGIVFVSLLRHNGGFSTSASFQMTFIATIQGLERNAYAVLRAVQILFTARTGILDPSLWSRLVASSRLITACICAVFCLLVVWRMPRTPGSGVAQFFVLGASSLAVANSLSGFFSITTCCGGPNFPNFPNTAIRYVMPIYVFMSLAATLESQKLLFAVQNRRLRNGIGSILALAALPFFGAGAQTAINAAHKPSGLMRAKGVDLTAWLLTHHFSYGLSDYYASQMIINLSRGQIRTSPVNVWGGKLTLYRWNGDTSLWNQTQSPQFFVISPDSSAYGITADTVYASYGTPQKIYHVGSYTVEQFISP